MRRFAGIAAIVACVAFGCGKRSVTFKDSEGATVTVDQGGGKVEIKGPGVDGSVAISAGGVKVPEDFPEDIPVYPGATPIIHTSVKGGRMLQLKTSDAIDKVRAFYKEKLKAEGWKEESESSTDAIKLLNNTKDTRTLSVVITQGDDGTSLTLSVSTKE
jgi:hypothetical protein